MEGHLCDSPPGTGDNKVKAKAREGSPPSPVWARMWTVGSPRVPNKKKKKNQSRGAAIAVIGANLGSSLPFTRNWLCDFGQGT